MASPSPKQRAVSLKRNGFDDGVIGAILGIDSTDVRSLLYDAAPDVQLVAPDASIVTVTTLLSHDDILGLNLDPVEIAPDPGDDLFLPLGILVTVGQVAADGGWEPAVAYTDIAFNSYIYVRTRGGAGGSLNTLYEELANEPQVSELLGGDGVKRALFQPLTYMHSALDETTPVILEENGLRGPWTIGMSNSTGALTGGDEGNVMLVLATYTILGDRPGDV